MASRTERAYSEAGQHGAQHGQTGLPARARERGCQEVLPARRIRYAHDLRADNSTHLLDGCVTSINEI